MVDSWKLTTIGMWIDKLDISEVIKLMENNFTLESLWEAAVEVNKLCADREMSLKIPKNRDQGAEKSYLSVPIYT